MHFDHGLWILRTVFVSYCAMEVVRMAGNYVMEAHESHLSKKND
jgi:hypothetical protein